MKIKALIYLLLCACSCSDESSILPINKEQPVIDFISKADSTLSVKNDTLFIKGIKYSGFVYELDSTTKDSISVNSYKYGLLHGRSKKWYSNKQLMEIRFYSDGKKNGRQASFWQNGNKRFEFFAKDDRYEGELKEWNVEGKLIHLANFKNGQEEGAQKLWYDNGKIRANYVVIQGKRYGLLGTKNCRNVSDSIFAVK
jgi:antitoxin component YwqK of YwqJK toxin-antitoxin module